MPFIDRRTGRYVDSPSENTLAIEDPRAIATEVYPGSFDLPATPEALTGLRGLQTSGVRGLETLLAEGPTAARDAVERALFERAAETINRSADDLAREINEGTFARGVGVSTITSDMQQRLQRERMDALARARREAVVGAGAESRADYAARLAGLNQAFSAGTGGLQAEANVGLANTGREQQARQFGATSAFENLINRLNREQRGLEFGTELGARERLQERGFRSAEDIAERQMLGTGIAAGIGGLATLFGPALQDRIRGLF